MLWTVLDTWKGKQLYNWSFWVQGQTHDITSQLVTKCNDTIQHNNNNAIKTGKRSNSATISIIHAPVAAGKSADETDKQK